MAATRPTLRDRNRARARAEIVAAARRLFLTYGYARTSVEQVAAEAGVAPRTVFRHFPRKEDLVFHRHAEELGRFRRLLAEQPPQRPALDALVDALLGLLGPDAGDTGDTTGDRGEMLKLLEREPELQRRDEALIADHHAAVADFLRERGADQQHAELLAGAFMGAIGSARKLVHVQPQRPPREHLTAAIELLRGLDWPAAPMQD
ncbi:TetR family transcriptional regulator [Conexibacter stalactiti]|uniref:TetR family transcriptional regulator n=1 Tax=Conexibacter stalactiti TaxID=1940611 RepID=A0ABU4HR78_9ACTN|nr:TetR family transcriptional regulator [Conexibacter stalactiti]MDW5595704.1 TetR family transcriptional regulator [Conexibacter stalactiti]MEC5036346.1 TetR family transcriptional regulator [Conexibacter stalactiti]